MDHYDNRLQAWDRSLIRERMDDKIGDWRSSYAQTGGRLKATPEAREILVRVGLGGIGCSPDDMRDSEMDEITALADRLLTEATGR